MSLAVVGSPSSGATGATDAQYDEYVSDPAKPVPYLSRPVASTTAAMPGGMAGRRPALRRWPPRRADLRERAADRAGAGERRPIVNLYASTSGTDSDWVVKLIDVYPGTVPSRPDRWAGYELPISLDIFRGRYRASFEHPAADHAGQAAALSIRPAYGKPRVLARPSHHGAGAVDACSRCTTATRRPLCRIFSTPSPADYQKATQRIWHTPGEASFISLAGRALVGK